MRLDNERRIKFNSELYLLYANQKPPSILRIENCNRQVMYSVWILEEFPGSYSNVRLVATWKTLQQMGGLSGQRKLHASRFPKLEEEEEGEVERCVAGLP